MEASMRWAGRIIGLLMVVIILFTLLVLSWGAAVWAMVPVDWAPIIILMILTLIALVGCIVSWWRVRLAGILIVVVSIILCTFWGVYLKPNERQYFIYGLALDLPLFFAGVLFLFSWWLSKRIR